MASRGRRQTEYVRAFGRRLHAGMPLLNQLEERKPAGGRVQVGPGVTRGKGSQGSLWPRPPGAPGALGDPPSNWFITFPIGSDEA
jgi:hypothetical protein